MLKPKTTLQVRKKNPPRIFRKPQVIEVMSQMDRVKRTLARLDKLESDRVAARNANKFVADRQSVPLDLTKPEDIMSVTNNACWRPDIYLNAGKYCDACPLFEWCRSPSKRLKEKGARKDKTAAFLKEQGIIFRTREEETMVRFVRQRAPFRPQRIVKTPTGRIFGCD